MYHKYWTIGKAEQNIILICKYSYKSYIPTFIDIPLTILKKSAEKL